MSASWFSVSKATLIDILTKLTSVFDTKADASHTHTKSDITDFAHDHPLSIEAASTATSAINLDPNAIYKLTAGGKTFIFKTPADSDHYAWADITGKPSSYPPSAHTHTVSQITDFPSTMPPSSHTHGNVQNGGTLQTNDVAIANGDKLVITDSSDSSKIARASIAFDGSTTTKYLSQKGTWESLTKAMVTTALGYTPPTSDTNTTYTLATGTGDDANKLVFTPSSGSATKLTVPYASNAGTVNGKTVAVNVPADAVFTDHTYNFNGTAFTSNNSNGQDANNVTYNAHTYYTSNGPATSLGASTNDGALYTQAYSSIWVVQIAQDYRNGRLFVRGKNNGTWQSWARVALTGESQPASDVYAWAKASSKPSYTLDEVTDGSTRKLANYLPLSGGTLTGDIGIPTAKSTIRKSGGTVPAAGTLASGSVDSKIDANTLHNYKTFIGTTVFTNDGNKWGSVISVRHRNGNDDGNNYGFYIRCRLTESSGLIYRQQWGGTWQAERTIWDSSNLTNLNQLSNGPGYLTSVSWSDVGSKPTSFTPSSHTHGNIQNGGTLQTNDITIASGDKLVVTDSSDSSKIARASISFDGSTATKCLTQKGTWETFASSNTDTKVTQTDTTTNVGYEVLLSESPISNSGTLTEGARKSKYFYYIPGSAALYLKNPVDETSFWFSAGISKNTSAVEAHFSIGNNIASGTTGNRYGTLSLFSKQSYYAKIKTADTYTASRTFTLPDKTGTIALTSDIPDFTLTAMNTITTVGNAYYTFNGTNGVHYGYYKYGRIVVAVWNVYCPATATEAATQKIGSGFPKPANGIGLTFGLGSQNLNRGAAIGIIDSNGDAFAMGGCNTNGSYYYGICTYIT